jgi:hypothetical protein
MVLSSLAGIGSGLRRTLADTTPNVLTNPFAISRGYHRLLRLYYENEMFSDAALWQSYRAAHRLPRTIRPIYNHTRRVCDWHAGRIYQGAWTEDGRPLPDGTPHALQFPTDLIDKNPALVIAALQSLNWGNWNANRVVYVREMGVLGTAFIEVVDDMVRRKVYPEIVPLERVGNISLDATGNVKAYELSYKALDERGMSYDYRKTVDQDEIVEYRDRAVLSRTRNPYGFVPAIWVKNRSTNSVFGAPHIAGVIAKIDEINRLATDVHNYVAKLQAQPVIFWSRQAPAPLAAIRTRSDDDMSAREAAARTVAEDTQAIPWMWGQDPDGRVENMMQAVPIDGAGVRIDKLAEEIEADLPELTMDRELRSMSNVTGPGADRMMGDVRGRYDEVQANADAGTVKIIQMSVAIAGWRVATGSWGMFSQLDRQQQKFRGFDLDSYAKGDLDLSLLPRPLIPSTEQERLMAIQLRKEVAGLPDDTVRRQLGYTEEEIRAMNSETEAQNERTPAFAAF